MCYWFVSNEYMYILYMVKLIVLYGEIVIKVFSVYTFCVEIVLVFFNLFMHKLSYCLPGLCAYTFYAYDMDSICSPFVKLLCKDIEWFCYQILIISSQLLALFLEHYLQHINVFKNLWAN